jgi:hypothetical protein
MRCTVKKLSLMNSTRFRETEVVLCCVPGDVIRPVRHQSISKLRPQPWNYQSKELISKLSNQQLWYEMPLKYNVIVDLILLCYRFVLFVFVRFVRAETSPREMKSGPSVAPLVCVRAGSH